jgi:hypothetical protein
VAGGVDKGRPAFGEVGRTMVMVQLFNEFFSMMGAGRFANSRIFVNRKEKQDEH